MRPEEALEAARAAAARARERGAYADEGPVRFAIEPTDRISIEHLLEWAVIEPDLAEVYSTRRFGAPITWVKRGLVRALRQYNAQVVAQQTRFNLQLALYVEHLSDRVARLEEESERRRPS